jgi:hypothetical protein
MNASFATAKRRRRIGSAAVTLALALTTTAAQAAEPWGFEQVTPVVKGSGAVSTAEFFQASPDGQRLLHSSVLPYESLPVASAPVLSKYVATRGPDGWGNMALDPPYLMPQDPVVAQSYFHATVATSRNLDWAVVVTRVPLTPDANPEGGGAYLKNTRTGEVQLIYTTDSEGWRVWESGQNFVAGTGWNYVADDGKSVIFQAHPALGPLTPDAPSSGVGLYSWSESSGLRYEGYVDGEAVSGLGPGWEQSGPRNSMPLDDHGLDHVYFQPGGSGTPAYVMEGPAGARTSRLVSYSRLVAQPDPPVPTLATVLAVGEGGRFALVQTGDNTPIAGGEPADPLPDTRFLYVFDAEAEDPADELKYVGAVGSIGGSGPGATRIVQMSQDGKTVAFYSPIAQAGSPDTTVQKLFVWREGHGLTYLYTPDAGSTGLNTTAQARQLSDNDRYLVFVDNSASLAAQFGMANNVAAACPTVAKLPGPCDQTYRYDLETGDFDCVSCRTDGIAPLGHSAWSDRASGPGQIWLNRYQVRMAADDGTVFFTSRDALLAEDRNARDDVYAWHHDSGLRLISPATPGQRARFIDASSDGKVVFIATRERLAASDKDAEEDVYATFAGAGFEDADEAGTVAPCVGGDCRDRFSAPGGPLIASEGYSGSGNVETARRASLAVAGSRAVAGRVAVLRVRVPAAGRVTVTGGQVRNSRRAVGKAQTISVRVALTPKARRGLAMRNRLAVRVRVAFAPRSGPAVSKTVRLTFTNPKSSRHASSKKGGR